MPRRGAPSGICPPPQSDERIKWLCHHSHLVQSIYLQAWRGDAFQLTELTAYPDLAAIEAWVRPYYPVVRAFADTVDESTFSQPVDFPWSAMIAEKFGKVLPATLSESVVAGRVAQHLSPRAAGDADSGDWRRAAPRRLSLLGLERQAGARVVMTERCHGPGR